MDLKIFFLIVMMNQISSSSAELLRAPQQPYQDYAFTKFRPPPSPPAPTFIQRITSWFFPWGYGAADDEDYNEPALSKIDHFAPPAHNINIPVDHQQNLPKFTPIQVRDTEPTTSRTTRAPNKCSPCNKVPWIPMMPTYQLPIVKGNQQSQQTQQQQIYFKHHFGNENQYAQVPAVSNAGYKYNPPSVPTLSTRYGPPITSTFPPSTTPIKLQQNVGYHVYGVHSQKPIKTIQPTGYRYPTTAFSTQQSVTTVRPNLNTIDTSVITFTTNRPQNNRPSRFTSAVNSITNPEYLPPSNVLPLEGEIIPIPNLSHTPIPPLFDAKDFHENIYTNQKTGFIKIVPLEPTAQLSNNANAQFKPTAELQKQFNNNGIEIISSNLVAEFTIPPETTRDEKIDTSRQEKQILKQNPSVVNIDIKKNIDSINMTLSAPIEESNTADNAIAESENNYQQNVKQQIEVLSFDQIKNDDDDDNDRAIIDQTNRVPLLLDNNLNKAGEEEDETTTEGNYYVKFEPSIQTAVDLAEEARRKNQTNNYKKQRETPLELLDSPIFHLTPTARTTLKPTKAYMSYTHPLFKPMEDYPKKLETLWYSATSSLPITTLEAITTTEIPKTSTQPTNPSKLSSISKLSSSLFSRITLPKEPAKPIISSTKKPKQIQIVIPYTTYHKPSPFKTQNEQEIITYRPIRGHYVTHPPRLIKETSAEPSEFKESSTYPAVSFEPLFNAHGYHNDQEFHEHVQESKIVESKVSIEFPKPTRQLTKIVANNIRDLLRKEKTPRPPKVDIIKLQKSIDGWTEQTFKGKASTITLTGHTKSIPSSFLTTTSRASSYMKIPTTTLAPKTTFDPDLMEETRQQYDNILYKREEPYVKRHDRYLDRDNELLLINNNLTQNFIQPDISVKIFAPKTTLSPKELWKRLHVTVSPLTNEKVYVVTPQPIKEYFHQESTIAYKPRFAIRPTLSGIKTGKKLKQEVSRRMDDSMDLIHTDEAIDGHSKVVKIITPEREEVTKSIDSTTTEKSSHS